MLHIIAYYEARQTLIQQALKTEVDCGLLHASALYERSCCSGARLNQRQVAFSLAGRQAHLLEHFGVHDSACASEAYKSSSPATGLLYFISPLVHIQT